MGRWRWVPKSVSEFLDHLKSYFKYKYCDQCLHYIGRNCRGFILCDKVYPGRPGSDAWGGHSWEAESCEHFMRRAKIYVVLEFEATEFDELKGKVLATLKSFDNVVGIGVYKQFGREWFGAVSQASHDAMNAFMLIPHRIKDFKCRVRIAIVNNGKGELRFVEGNFNRGVERVFEIVRVDESKDLNIDLSNIEQYTAIKAVKIYKEGKDQIWEEWGWQKGLGTLHIKARYIGWGFWSSSPPFFI